MNRAACHIEILGETFSLLSDKAVWWPKDRTLFVADTHFGKAAAFRTSGIPVPDTTQEDLSILTRLIRQWSARRLVILGDFWHGPQGRTPEVMQTLQSWRSDHARLETILVRGNHDLRSGEPPAEWDIHCTDLWESDGLVVGAHEPRGFRGKYVLSGHVHPAVVLRDPQGGSLRAPCFVWGPDRAILPAFGSFTGMENWFAQPSERVFAVGPNAVVQIPTHFSPT